MRSDSVKLWACALATAAAFLPRSAGATLSVMHVDSFDFQYSSATERFRLSPQIQRDGSTLVINAADGPGHPVWIESKPIPVGGGNLAELQSIGFSLDLTGQFPDPWFLLTSAFIRYSSDQEHWSTWQSLENTTLENERGVRRHFKGAIQIPEVVRERYSALFSSWIMQRHTRRDDPDFLRIMKTEHPEILEKDKPVIRFLEILVEGNGRPVTGKLQKIDLHLGYELSGIRQ